MLWLGLYMLVLLVGYLGFFYCALCRWAFYYHVVFLFHFITPVVFVVADLDTLILT